MDKSQPLDDAIKIEIRKNLDKNIAEQFHSFDEENKAKKNLYVSLHELIEKSYSHFTIPANFNKNCALFCSRTTMMCYVER